MFKLFQFNTHRSNPRYVNPWVTMETVPIAKVGQWSGVCPYELAAAAGHVHHSPTGWQVSSTTPYWRCKDLKMLAGQHGFLVVVCCGYFQHLTSHTVRDDCVQLCIYMACIMSCLRIWFGWQFQFASMSIAASLTEMT